MFPRALLAVLLASIGVSCDSEANDPPSAAAVLTGVVVEVDSRGLGDVRSFTLRSKGRNRAIFIAPDVDYDFPLPHLNQHLTSADPVRVEVFRSEGKLFARSIEDA